MSFHRIKWLCASAFGPSSSQDAPIEAEVGCLSVKNLGVFYHFDILLRRLLEDEGIVHVSDLLLIIFDWLNRAPAGCCSHQLAFACCSWRHHAFVELCHGCFWCSLLVPLVVFQVKAYSFILGFLNLNILLLLLILVLEQSHLCIQVFDLVLQNLNIILRGSQVVVKVSLDGLELLLSQLCLHDLVLQLPYLGCECPILVLEQRCCLSMVLN